MIGGELEKLNFIEKISLIIIDEFPCLCVSNSALPSILQKIWDEKAKENNILDKSFTVMLLPQQ